MKKIIFIIIFFTSFFVYAQNDIDFCAYNSSLDARNHPWKGNNQFLLDYITKYNLLDSFHVYYRVPICFHIYKKKSTSDASFYEDIKSLIYRLNDIYTSNKTGIFFYVSDVIFYDEPKQQIH